VARSSCCDWSATIAAWRSRTPPPAEPAAVTAALPPLPAHRPVGAGSTGNRGVVGCNWRAAWGSPQRDGVVLSVEQLTHRFGADVAVHRSF